MSTHAIELRSKKFSKLWARSITLTSEKRGPRAVWGEESKERREKSGVLHFYKREHVIKFAV